MFSLVIHLSLQEFENYIVIPRASTKSSILVITTDFKAMSKNKPEAKSG